MILLDTNILIFAFDPDSPFSKWARGLIADAVVGDGAAINAVSLAEICVGDEDPSTAADRVRSYGVEILDVPVAAADVCAKACRFRIFSLAPMPRSWGGNLPQRIEVGSVHTFHPFH